MTTLTGGPVRRIPADGSTGRLSPRDVQILAGLARGHTAATIASNLETTEWSVKSRTRRMAILWQITGAHHAALVDRAYRHGHLIVVRQRALPPLTGRLAQVLECAACGLGVRATAADIGISTETVRTHRQRLLQKLGAPCMARAVAVAWEAGILGPLPRREAHHA
ncbi:helix-turn-helix transcriptional regulator [Streptomyces sp. Amel2xC10]|uniref:helix-turn-helix transcriptional regulator n=1 Tax=Streptomyces sp. Amel2xC10 TaxID=1305826 RepID=UPI000A086A0A|nr:helix-turn-helix transcriptional regulator [Streptomyces sp. Amel2xC10]SMF86418.1 Response regulator containing a CheY-like receiver domain and an HTH DNA-binding domain [Streptomyces sp. Amel2xC10]